MSKNDQPQFGPNYELSVKLWMLDLGLQGYPLLLFAWLWRASEEGNRPVRIEYENLKKLLRTNSNNTVNRAVKNLQKQKFISLTENGKRGFLHSTFANITAPVVGAVNAPVVGAVTAPVVGEVKIHNGCCESADELGKRAPLTRTDTDTAAADAPAGAGAREGAAEQAEQPVRGQAVKVVQSRKHGGFIAFCPGSHQRPAYERVEVGQTSATCRTCGTHFALDWSDTEQGRAAVRQAVKERAASLPSSAPCPVCGHDAAHQGGRTYYCAACDVSFSLPR